MKRRLELYSRVEPDMPEAVGKISLRTKKHRKNEEKQRFERFVKDYSLT